MKTIFLYILILLPIINFGQTKLEGQYCIEPGMCAKCFTFKNDSLFEYIFIGDLGPLIIKGSGKYKIKKNLLTLFFKNNDTTKSSFFIKDTIDNNIDSITFSFLVIDKDVNEPVPFTTINVMFSKNKSYKTITDMDGLTKLKLVKSQKDCIIRINYLSFKSCSFKIKANKSKEIEIYFASLHGLIENGTIWKYKIMKNDSKQIELKDKNNKDTTTYYKH